MQPTSTYTYQGRWLAFLHDRTFAILENVVIIGKTTEGGGGWGIAQVIQLLNYCPIYIHVYVYQLYVNLNAYMYNVCIVTKDSEFFFNLN